MTQTCFLRPTYIERRIITEVVIMTLGIFVSILFSFSDIFLSVRFEELKKLIFAHGRIFMEKKKKERPRSRFLKLKKWRGEKPSFHGSPLRQGRTKVKEAAAVKTFQTFG